MDREGRGKGLDNTNANNRKTVISDLSDEDYQSVVQGVVSNKREKAKSLKEQTADWSFETQMPRLHNFNRREEEAQVVETITKDQLLGYYRTYIKKGGEKRCVNSRILGILILVRAKLSVRYHAACHPISEAPEQDNYLEISDKYRDWQKQEKFYTPAYIVTESKPETHRCF